MVIRRRTRRKLVLWLVIFSLIFGVFASTSAAGKRGCWKLFGFPVFCGVNGD
jgi:hypothetical protein